MTTQNSKPFQNFCKTKYMKGQCKGFLIYSMVIISATIRNFFIVLFVDYRPQLMHDK